MIPPVSDAGSFRAVPEAPAVPGRGEAARWEAAAAARRLAAEFPAYEVTPRPGWAGYALHAVARAGADAAGVYAAVSGSEDEVRDALAAGW